VSHEVTCPRVSHFWYIASMSASPPRELVWIASSLKDLREFPEDVRQMMGYALYTAQSGGKHIAAKPLQGIGVAECSK
jgi:phage-related protein